MKTTLVASVVLIATLSGFSSARADGFIDRGALPETISTRSAPQDLRHLPVVHGFNQQSHHAVATIASPVPAGRPASTTVGARCDLAPRFGFQNGSSFAPC